MLALNRLAPFVIAAAAMVLASGVASAGPKAYVGNFADNTVSVIDTADNKVVATVPVATGPHGMAISPDGRSVYVTGDGSSSMSIIDTASDKVAKTIDVGKTPNGLALTPDGKLLLVAVYGEDRVAFLDTATQAVVGSVAVAKPHTVAVSPDGSLAYVTSQAPGAAALVVVNIASRIVASSLALDKTPRDGEFGYDGKAFYFTQAGVDALQVLDPTSNKVVAQIPTGASPHFVKLFRGAAFGLATVQGPGQVLLFDPATNQPVKTIAVGKQPHWIALSGDGKTAYVPNEGSNDVSIVNLAAGTTTTVAVGNAPRKVVVQQSPQQAAATPTPPSSQQAATAGAAAGATISIAGFAFAAQSKPVHAGDSVTWTNNDGAIHTVTFKDGSPGATALSPGQSFTRTFDRPGTYDFFCSFHPYMTGTVMVSQ
jgi:YVTN family beta-propeller protein